MKRVILRVTESGDVLVSQGGDNQESLLLGPYSDGVPYSRHFTGPTQLLPFYALTDREEQELLAGRARTEYDLVCAKIAEADREIERQLAFEKGLNGQIEVSISSPDRSLSNGSLNVGYRFMPRVRAEERKQELLAEAEKKYNEMLDAEERAREEARKEISRGGPVGRILPGFGKKVGI